MLPHDNDITAEVIAIAFTTSEPDGVLLLQNEINREAKDGDFILLQSKFYLLCTTNWT